MLIDQKRCSKCGEIKVTADFHKNKSRKDGLSGWCKGCLKKCKQKWRAANPEKSKKRNRKYRQANLEKIKKYKQDYYAANFEKIKEKNREYRQVNIEKIKKYKQEWGATNSEKISAAQHRRRSYKRGNGGAYIVKDIEVIFNQQGGRCNACGKKLIRYNKKQYHIDHIIPLARGGSNNPENIQLLCPSCNLSKSNKDPIQWARENGRLF